LLNSGSSLRAAFAFAIRRAGLNLSDVKSQGTKFLQKGSAEELAPAQLTAGGIHFSDKGTAATTANKAVFFGTGFGHSLSVSPRAISSRLFLQLS